MQKKNEGKWREIWEMRVEGEFEKQNVRMLGYIFKNRTVVIVNIVKLEINNPEKNLVCLVVWMMQFNAPRNSHQKFPMIFFRFLCLTALVIHTHISICGLTEARNSEDLLRVEELHMLLEIAQGKFWAVVVVFLLF